MRRIRIRLAAILAAGMVAVLVGATTFGSGAEQLDDASADNAGARIVVRANVAGLPYPPELE